MKSALTFLILICMIAACENPDSKNPGAENPFFPKFNEAIRYNKVTNDHIKQYVDYILNESEAVLEQIRKEESPDFKNVFVAYDRVVNDLEKASNNSFLFYWVSTDSLAREQGLASYQQVDSMMNSLSSDAKLFAQMKKVAASAEYTSLGEVEKNLVDDVILHFQHAGVDLDAERLEKFKKLKAEISDLSSQYSINMNTANEILEISEAEAEGIPENFLNKYGSPEEGYKIPVIPATRQPVLNNARMEKTRKSYMMQYQNRAADKNLPILDELVRKRYELAQLMDFRSYAAYTTSMKMSKNPENVWNFLDDLIERSGEKAEKDHETLKKQRNKEKGIRSDAAVNPWDIAYYRNQILKNEYDVDQEQVRSYLPVDKCLAGLIDLYGELLDLKIIQVKDPAVWYKDVLLYEVYKDDALKGRFYLDLYPRPHKESWFYGVEIAPGFLTDDGYEVPVCMLLGNFTAPTETTPSLLSFGELNTLFHEFGHIMENMNYDGKYATQSGSKEDFGEAMSQIFENWIWDYDILSSFAAHYETGEVFPREVFGNMEKAKNITSGIDAQRSLASCVYDMVLYDKYDPARPIDTDELWREIDKMIAVPQYIEGSHPQASWIHINTHPTYYYGYLWAEVYAQDMFTRFKEQGLRDTKTGVRYRELVLSNGTQRDILPQVEEFLGRKSNNEAYIKSLGLE